MTPWQLRTRTLPLGRRTLLMGILNVTPDSFTDGGLHNTPATALDQAGRMLDEGADLLDLGAESTRPGATPLPPADEQQRLLPILRALRKARSEAILSVDTYHADTARIALAEGAEIINDVSGLTGFQQDPDPGMAEVLAEARPGVVLMHTRGTPQTWHSLPPLTGNDVQTLVFKELQVALKRANEAQIPAENIVLDPGFGFGKLGPANFALLAALPALQALGRPLLIGLSRKRFLTQHLQNATPAQREQATNAAHVAAILNGASILRVHDVASARLAADIADSVRQACLSPAGSSPASSL